MFTIVTHRSGVINLSHNESSSQGCNSTLILNEPACWSQGLAGLIMEHQAGYQQMHTSNSIGSSWDMMDQCVKSCLIYSTVAP